MTEVPGCSPELYGRNKIACLKKFLNLVKTPISKYIGTDLLNPLINILNRPISIATTSNIQEIGHLLQSRMNCPRALFSSLIESYIRINSETREGYQDLMNLCLNSIPDLCVFVLFATQLTNCVIVSLDVLGMTSGQWGLFP